MEKKFRLLLLLALLLTAATGAWAQDAKHLITATYREQTRSLEQPLPYATTIGELYEAVTGEPFSGLISFMSSMEMPLTGITSRNTSVVSIGELNGASTPVTVNADGKATISINFGSYAHGIFVSVNSPLYAYMKDGVKDAGKWTVKVGEGQAQALPIGGLTGDGSETVTLQYTGRLKVKGVKATSDAAASVTEVKTFSELQAALSAGKDVKLMSDIVCTEEINITSGALTIDGNGKTLSTTSAIRAFKVGSTATVAFKNLTLREFVSGGGPAINNSGTIVLDKCTIANCHVNNTNGGGAIENKGKLYAINTIFSGNYSGEIGGAINNYTGSLYMSGCTFINNYTTKSDAYYGGAIGINMGSEVRLINCYFSENKYLGTTAGPSDIGVYNNPTNYTIAGCTGATIASRVGVITPNTTGTATLDYSDLSNISFTYTAEGIASTPLDNTTTAWTAGSYAVPAGGLTYSDAITVSGDVTLVLTDGTTLTLNKGISLAEGATLTIQGNGAMVVNGTNENTTSTVAGSTGTLTLTSGTLTATGGNGGSGDFESHGDNGGDAINGSVIVSGGTLTATGGNGGSTPYGYYDSHGGNGGDAISGSVTVSGGTLTARGGNGGSVGDFGTSCSGGKGGDAISGTLTKNGGSTSVNDGSNGSIGSGCDNSTAGTGGKGHN